ncbi:MAG: disulfide bond formation protein B [Xanthobacteraceae bacterium]
MTRSLSVTLNALALYAIALVLIAAFAAQLLLGELPCPLCLLQRVQFALLAVGPLLNLRFGPRPSHYALSLLVAAAGATFAMRQVLLHIMPGDPGYGSALLGYHYYTWAFIGFAVATLAVAAMLLFDGQFEPDDKAPAVGAFARLAVWLVLALTALNVVATLLECGFAACPDDPVAYELLKAWR